jgi:molybdopterin converting factor small subunit
MQTPLILHDLAPDPRDEWARLLAFVGWGERDRQAAARSVEALFQRGHELVVATYDHLASRPETAAILSGQDGPDPEHLEERRRFLTIWLARTLGLDTSGELALYLFRAGLMHHGLGPRAVHVPPAYVIGSMGLIQAGFARILAEAGLPSDALAGALGAWSRYLSVHLDLLLMGYRAAGDLTDGRLAVRCSAYGRLRALLHGREVAVAVEPGGNLAEVLRKLFNAYPEVRAEVLDRRWDERDPGQHDWPMVTPAYLPRPGWRLLLNGRDAGYEGGLEQPVAEGDEVALFPPGR